MKTSHFDEIVITDCSGGCHTKFQLVTAISAIHKFLEDILQNSQNISETPSDQQQPWYHCYKTNRYYSTLRKGLNYMYYLSLKHDSKYNYVFILVPKSSLLLKTYGHCQFVIVLYFFAFYFI